jgi:hypothetical protein
LAQEVNLSSTAMRGTATVEKVMAQLPRFQIGPSVKIPSDIEELGRKIDGLPEAERQRLRPVYERVLEGFRLRNRIMNVAKEALERIRLEVACLQFDLEVTRREKESLQQRLEGD